MYMYSFQTSDLQAAMNTAKEATIVALEREGLLKKPSDEILRQYVVVINEPGWFGKMYDKLVGIPPEKSFQVNVAKVV